MENNNNGKLLQYFGLTTGIILIVSSIIGTGVYKKVAPMSLNLQSPELVLLAWGLAGLVTLLGVLTVAEIAMLIPKSGGPFAYLREMYGEKTAYFYGWASFATIQSASTASISYVFAQSLNSIVTLPRLSEDWEAMNLFGIFYPFANIGVKLMAVLLIAVLTAVNYRGVKQGGRVSNVITVIVLASLALIIVLGLTVGGGSMANITQPASTYPPSAFGESFGFMKLIFLAMLSAFWAYEGWMNVGFVGDEIRNPQRNIPRILIFGILLIITIYLLVNFTYLYVMPVDEMLHGYVQTDAAGNFLTNQDGTFKLNDNFIAAVEVIRKFFGNGGAFFISLLIVVTTMGCTNATILTAARIYYAMAEKGLFFKRAAFVHPKFRTPSNALVMFAVWSSVLVFSGTFDQLTDMMVFSQFIFYGLVVAGIFILRKKMKDAPRSYRTLGYPVVPLLFVLFCAVFILNTLIEKPREAGMGLALIVLGTPFYFLFKKR
ncbi:MAG: amino acid permease [Bacteroidota bacterium]